MYCKPALALVLLAFLHCCAKPEFTHRVAVLRFENLTPDPETDWLGRALSEEISGQLEGTRRNAVIPFWTIHQIDATRGARPVSAPGISAELTAAGAAGANRILTGFYCSRHGQLSITSIEETVGKPEQLKLNRVSGTVDDVLHLAAEIAHSIDEEALPPLTGNARTLRDYALGLETAPEQNRALLTEAVQLDPDFGPAYLALAQIALAERDTAEFGRVFAAVRARGNGVRAVDRALLNLEDARLHATLATKIDALSAVSRLLPADPFRLEELGTGELQANRYTEAADHFRKLATMMPSSPVPLSLLGYASMYGGDEAGAMKALHDYGEATGNDASALDATGNVQFFFGHFPKAEALYRAAYERNPEAAEGCELLKMAWCRMMQSQPIEQLVREYRTARQRAGDAAAESRATRLMSIAGARGVYDGPLTNPAVAALARKDYQTALPLWRKLAEDAPPDEWWIKTVYAKVLLASGQTMEAARYLKFTPLPEPAREDHFDELWYSWILDARK